MIKSSDHLVHLCAKLFDWNDLKPAHSEIQEVVIAKTNNLS